MPFKVACAGIDRYFERYYRKGPRRRPVRIEFCEADVLDAFDDWRRAVGSRRRRGRRLAHRRASRTPSPTEIADAQARRLSLAAHIERPIARLTAARRASTNAVAGPMMRSTATVRALDALLTEARAVRGHARAALVDQLSELDRRLIADAIAFLDPDARRPSSGGTHVARAVSRSHAARRVSAREPAKPRSSARFTSITLPVVSYDGV